MKPNGRRAWRRFAKQQRRKVNRRNRQTGTPWINDADGAFYRHEQKHFEQRPIVPVGPFTARSLVGMSQSARKRAIRALFVELVFISQGTAIEPTDKGSRWFHLWCRGSGDAASRDPEYAALRAKHRIGERLRPCPGCANCDPYMASYGSFYGGDPRNFTPDEECSTEAERERHRQHCEAWEKGERPTVKVSGIEWTEAMTSTGRDGKPKTFPAGYKFVERTAYGLGVTRATNDQEGRFCDGSGVLPARKKP